MTVSAVLRAWSCSAWAMRAPTERDSSVFGHVGDSSYEVLRQQSLTHRMQLHRTSRQRSESLMTSKFFLRFVGKSTTLKLGVRESHSCAYGSRGGSLALLRLPICSIGSLVSSTMH